MVIKSISVLAIYFIPYVLMLTGVVSSLGGIFALFAVMGFGMSFIGMSVMHDANHDAYSSKTWANKLFGWMITLVGGYVGNWKLQHNVLHHTFTNVEGHDDDIDAGFILRFSPHDKRLGIHGFQHIYAWFLYGFMTLQWITSHDYGQLNRYTERGLIKKEDYWRQFAVITAYKIFYYGYTLVLPIILLDIAWWQTLLAFLTMHFIAGVVLSTIFQLAHVMPHSSFPQADEKGDLENNWAIHQLLTTTNFAPKSKIVSWFIGGLNYQIEHHLFPNICHVHYKKISAIVKETANEYNIPYYEQPTVLNAVLKHAEMLRKLGKYDSPDFGMA
jgi:linoleoyl-CoA desaturase